MAKKKLSLKTKAFTLVEFIIVIGILAILLVFGVSFQADQRGKVRDVQRKSDIQKIASALERYRAKNGQFPCRKEISDTTFVNCPAINNPLNDETYTTTSKNTQPWIKGFINGTNINLTPEYTLDANDLLPTDPKPDEAFLGTSKLASLLPEIIPIAEAQLDCVPFCIDPTANCVACFGGSCFGVPCSTYTPPPITSTSGGWYKFMSNGRSYILFAKLENPSDSDLNYKSSAKCRIQHCDSSGCYNYCVYSPNNTILN